MDALRTMSFGNECCQKSGSSTCEEGHFTNYTGMTARVLCGTGIFFG